MFFHQKAGRTMPAKSKIAASEKKTANTAVASPNSTREHLIVVGLELIRRHGYGATGVQEILDAAGVPKGSFYHHFESKEEFTAAVLERYVTMAGEHAAKVLGNTRLTPLKRLRRYFEELIPMAGQTAPIQGCLIGSLSLEVAGVSPILQGGVSSGFVRWQAVVASVLREAVEKSELSPSARPESLAGFILNTWEGALLRSQADRSDAPLKDFLHYVFDEFLVGR